MQIEAAERLNVESSSLSNWERGTRTISLDLDVVDAALDGGGTLAGLLWAIGTRDGLEPGRVWTKVYPGESRPVWVWLRGDEGRLAIAAEWGVFRIDTELDIGPNGLFITVGASVPDSPVVIYLSEPAWADFGYGELPAEVPGAPQLTAAAMFEASTADGKFMELFRASLSEKLSSRSDDVIDLVKKVPDALQSYLGAGRNGQRSPKRWPPEPEEIDAGSRQAFGRLREARRLSLSETAEHLARQTGVEVGRDTLRRFETDVGVPHDPLLPIALDHVLGADGRLAALELRSSRGAGSVTMPSFWCGAVWIQFDTPSGADVVLHRGDWHRETKLEPGVTLHSVHWFDPTAPLRIKADENVRWTVGVGRLAGTKPIDQNWVPTRIDVAQQALSDVEQAMRTAVSSDHLRDAPSPERDRDGGSSNDGTTSE